MIKTRSNFKLCGEDIILKFDRFIAPIQFYSNFQLCYSSQPTSVFYSLYQLFSQPQPN
jgi:hypothetical protein